MLQVFCRLHFVLLNVVWNFGPPVRVFDHNRDVQRTGRVSRINIVDQVPCLLCTGRSDVTVICGHITISVP